MWSLTLINEVARDNLILAQGIIEFLTLDILANTKKTFFVYAIIEQNFTGGVSRKSIPYSLINISFSCSTSAYIRSI
jgi:hypothetical protein